MLNTGLPLFTSLCAITTIALAIASLIEDKLVECDGGEWFGFVSMTGGNISSGTMYIDLQKMDISTDIIDGVAMYAWPAMALTVSGILFSSLMVFFVFSKSESWRFTLLMGLLAIAVFLVAAIFSTVLVSRADNYVSMSTCTVGRDTYLLWAGCAVMIVGTRMHAKSESLWMAPILG